MILKKITSSSILISVLGLSLAVFSLQTPYAKAQSALSNTASLCPIEGEIEVVFKHQAEEYSLDDVFSEDVQISNGSAYTLGGIRVAIAAYRNVMDPVPAYWSVMSEEYQLAPGESVSVPIELGVSAVTAGEYVIKAFAMQGDETDLLGLALQDVNSVQGLKAVKHTNKESDITMTVSVNGEEFSGNKILLPRGEAINAEIKTINNDQIPFVGNKVLGVISQGNIPLGAAVSADKLESILLVPESFRLTKILEPYVNGSEYTIYAGLVSGDSLQSLVKVPVVFGGAGEDESWPYISKIGVSELPLQVDSEIVACVRYTGSDNGSDRFLGPLGVDFVISSARGEIASERKTNLDQEERTKNYFSFAPQQDLNDLTITVDLLQEVFMKSEEEGSVLEGSNFIAVNNTSFDLFCDNGDVCRGVTAPVVHVDIITYSFWHYAGITLAALLLMYLILMRLAPERRSGSVADVSPGELQ